MGLFDRLFGKKETPKVAEEKLEENLLTETTQKEELSEKANEQDKIEAVQQEDVSSEGAGSVENG
ncbi:TPA: signal recognition particle-docking protein FtsY, partial [Streptococcus pyogenes]